MVTSADYGEPLGPKMLRNALYKYYIYNVRFYICLASKIYLLVFAILSVVLKKKTREE